MPLCRGSRAKALAAAVRADSVLLEKELALFKACFRIAAEARVPLVVENVREAQRWVGVARCKYQSFYLWGDVPAMVPIADKGFKGFKGFKADMRNCEASRRWSSHSKERKQWSAQIAKIPLPLAQWIAKCFKPDVLQSANAGKPLTVSDRREEH